jgi:hypothetical protein
MINISQTLEESTPQSNYFQDRDQQNKMENCVGCCEQISVCYCMMVDHRRVAMRLPGFLHWEAAEERMSMVTVTSEGSMSCPPSMQEKRMASVLLSDS